MRAGRADGRAPDRRRDDRGRARRDRERDADAALRAPARRRRRARPGRRGRAALPLRPLRDADPLRALRAAALGRATSGSAGTRDRPRHARPRRRLARGERGRARAAARPRRRRRRPAADDRPDARARGPGASSGSSCRSCRGSVKGDAAGELDTGDGDVDGGAARALRRPDPGAARAPHPEPRVVDPRAASRSRPPTSRRRTSNLQHGDPYGGSLALDQNFLWRPFARSPGHRDAGRAALAHRREHLAGARASAPARGRSSRGSCSSRR